MNKFIMAVECPVCGELAKTDGMIVDFTAPEGVVCLNLFSQETFECDKCGTTIYTGDTEDALYYEESEDFDEDEEWDE